MKSVEVRKENFPFILTFMFPLNTAEFWTSSHHIILLCLHTSSARSYRQDKLAWLNFTLFFTCYWNKSGEELLSPDFLFRCLKGTIVFFHTLWKVTHVPTHFTYLKVAFCEDVKFSSNFIFYFECLAEISSKYYHINLFQVINQCLCCGIRKDYFLVIF